VAVIVGLCKHLEVKLQHWVVQQCAATVGYDNDTADKSRLSVCQTH
jgi:hypothetical protein